MAGTAAANCKRPGMSRKPGKFHRGFSNFPAAVGSTKSDNIKKVSVWICKLKLTLIIKFKSVFI
jgi:hypothetical protein